MDGMDIIFKLVTSPSLIPLLFPKGLVIGLGGIDMIFKLATLDDLDVCNFNQSIWIWLIQGFPEIVISNVGPFCPCYLGCASNRLCIKNSIGGEVNPHLYLCIIVSVLLHVLIFYLIIWLLKVSLEYYQSSLAIFSSPSYHIKGFILSPGVLISIVKGNV